MILKRMVFWMFRVGVVLLLMMGVLQVATAGLRQ
jgi:hypothetical protein